MPLLKKASIPSLAWWPPITPLGFAFSARGDCFHGNLRKLPGGDVVQILSPNIIHLCSTSYNVLFSPSLCVLNSHIPTLSIYSYSHLFTSYLKYVYKCVYKLKIISSYPVSKWHLQGKGCMGLRFLIALQEPVQKGSTEHCLTAKRVLSWLKSSAQAQSHVCSLSEKMTPDLGP